jgi:hypothetical protein
MAKRPYYTVKTGGRVRVSDAVEHRYPGDRGPIQWPKLTPEQQSAHDAELERQFANTLPCNRAIIAALYEQQEERRRPWWRKAWVALARLITRNPLRGRPARAAYLEMFR